MATAAKQVCETRKFVEQDKIINFSPEWLKAPFFLRCAAFCIDYIILLALPVVWLIVSGVLSETGTMSIGNTIWVLGFLFFFLNFLFLPLFRGQTIGKMLVGLTIINMDGTNISLGTLVRRNIFGYAVTFLTLGIGFLMAAVNSSGRSLHDIIAGTIVIRGRKTQV